MNSLLRLRRKPNNLNPLKTNPMKAAQINKRLEQVSANLTNCILQVSKVDKMMNGVGEKGRHLPEQIQMEKESIATDLTSIIKALEEIKPLILTMD